MQTSQRPSPFTPGLGYLLKVAGGVPPYQFVPAPSPPNPHGVTVSQVSANAVEVDVPLDTPPGTSVYVLIYDSSQPPNSLTVVNSTY